MINLSHLVELDWSAWVEARAASLSSTPPAPILIGEALRSSFNLDVVDGYHYLETIPFCFSNDEVPPPRAPIVVDLVALKASHKIETRDALWAYADTVISPREREAMTALFLEATLKTVLGETVNPWAFGVLAVTLAWCKEAMKQQETLSALIDDAVDVAAVLAVTPDFAALGLPPAVTAGQISVALTEV